MPVIRRPAAILRRPAAKRPNSTSTSTASKKAPSAGVKESGKQAVRNELKILRLLKAARKQKAKAAAKLGARAATSANKNKVKCQARPKAVPSKLAGDAPKDHPAHKWVKVARIRATFGLEKAWEFCKSGNPGKDSMQRDGVRWIHKAPRMFVKAEDAGSLEEAGRVARRLFQAASEGATLEEVRVLKRDLLKEVKNQNFSAARREVSRPSKRPRRDVASPGPLYISSLPCRVEEHKEASAPSRKSARKLFDMMNARETISKRRAKGMSGAQLYAELPKELSEYFSRRSCPNVRRRDDRTSKDLHRLASAWQRWSLCKNDAERERLKQLLVLNFAVWRFVGGTLAFARAVGFLTDWSDSEKERVRQVVRTAFTAGHAQSFFCDAYEGTQKIKKAFGENCDEDKLEALLYNTGPKAVANVEPMLTFFTLHGKLRVIDEIWQRATAIVHAAAPDEQGKIRWQRVANELGRLPYFGRDEDGFREPTFFAKEIAQDLLDTPIFGPGGRSSVCDLRSFCPAGPGAVLGLMLVFNLQEKPLQREAVPLMRALLSLAAEFWEHGDADDLELHDIQFMLCEVQKLFHSQNTHNSVRGYAGPCHSLADAGSVCLPWEQLLEDSLLLLASKDDGKALVPQEDLVETMLQWLGLPSGRMQDTKEHICHGDLVSLRPVSDTTAALGFKASGSLCKLSVQDCSCFRLERLQGEGELRPGDEIWLRSMQGSHLGPTTNKPGCRLAAPLGSSRFDEARLFKVKCAPDWRWEPAAAVPARGAAVFLQTRQLPLGLLIPPSNGAICSMAAEPSQLVLERLDVLAEAADSLWTKIRIAIAACLESGSMLREVQGLRLAEPESVRRRLIGCR
mmetsp:Transcript_15417/g.26995  ORF Transcript_15417/g.26995 Transcript_15417/m.26995 type:complete len:853 (-) Transcript_15417:83-2641(-)